MFCTRILVSAPTPSATLLSTRETVALDTPAIFAISSTVTFVLLHLDLPDCFVKFTLFENRCFVNGFYVQILNGRLVHFFVDIWQNYFAKNHRDKKKQVESKLLNSSFDSTCSNNLNCKKRSGLDWIRTYSIKNRSALPDNKSSVNMRAAPMACAFSPESSRDINLWLSWSAGYSLILRLRSGR